jgi:hypothetical protein
MDGLIEQASRERPRPEFPWPPDYRLFDPVAKCIERSLLAGTFFSSRARGA